MSRIDALKRFLDEDSNDSFSRYALAMEYIKIGSHDDGIAEFETLVRTDPAYVATYYQLGKAYERADRGEEAMLTYRNGIARATESGDNHTRDELSDALSSLEGSR